MSTPPDSATRKPKSSMPSRKKAINDMCKVCSYDKLAVGTWREQVRDCAAGDSCPLYPVRPLPTTRGDNIDVEEIE